LSADELPAATFHDWPGFSAVYLRYFQQHVLPRVTDPDRWPGDLCRSREVAAHRQRGRREGTEPERGRTRRTLRAYL
jgi:hypothetical protein